MTIILINKWQITRYAEPFITNNDVIIVTINIIITIINYRYPHY